MKKNLFLLAVAGICSWCHPDVSAQQKTKAHGEILLSGNWKIQSAAKVHDDGKKLSTSQGNTVNWFPANVPSTVMATLTANGLYKDIFLADNYKKADRSAFDTSWWYRTSFALPLEPNKRVHLVFDGISYRANIWINGKLIAPKTQVYGSFCRYSFDITGVAKPENFLAVEVFRAQKGEPNIGFVDWNPRPLDESMGLFRDVKVVITGDVGIENSWVKTIVDTATLKSAQLTVQTELVNYSDHPVNGTLELKLEGKHYSKPVNLAAKQRQLVKIDPAQMKALSITNPRLWWSHDLGKPELYQLNLAFVSGNKTSDRKSVTFGIRQIDTYFTGEGHRGYKLNGKKVFIKGAGWTDDIFLRDTPGSNERQVRYVKDMNLNTIRFENIWGTSQNIYDLCDQYGILALVGWSCQWEWEGYLGIPDDDFGCIRSEHDINLLTRYFEDQVKWLRNHPAIIAWYGGSDKLLRPELERRYLSFLKENDKRPYIGSAKGLKSEVTGPTGMKMLGPYEYVGPNYWFIDDKLGGAYGFNTETGTGAQLPVMESIEKMIPPEQLWPIGATWDAHCTTSSTALNSLKVLTKVMDAKYGAAVNLEDYINKAHLLGYESTKSMFEAFRVNQPKTTGIIQWMLNSAWPSMYWQLYDYYGIPTPTYYGVKKANQPAQLIYNYKDQGIYFVNESTVALKGAKAIVEVFSYDSKRLLKEKIDISGSSELARKIFTLDKMDQNTFLSLKLVDGEGKLITDNFYTLSSGQDVYDWENSDWVGSPMLSYASFKELNELPSASLEKELMTAPGNRMLQVKIKNTGENIAFFVNLKLKDAQGNIIVPVTWSDNYFTILPGETRIVECKLPMDMKKLGATSIQLAAWNMRPWIIAMH